MAMDVNIINLCCLATAQWWLQAVLGLTTHGAQSGSTNGTRQSQVNGTGGGLTQTY